MPVLAKVAAAQADGLMGGEHVTILRRFFTRLPLSVDAVTGSSARTPWSGSPSGGDPRTCAKPPNG